MLLRNESENYENHDSRHQTIIAALEARIAEGRTIDAALVTEGLLPGDNVKFVRAWALRNGVSAKDFDAAMRNHQIVRELGEMPKTPEQFVALILKRDNIKCRFNGLLSQQARPRVRSSGKLVEATPDDLADPTVATITHFTAPSTLTASELALRLRTTSANLNLPFTDTEIRDAVDMWMRGARRERLASIYMKVAHAGMPVFERDRADGFWLKLVDAAFDTSEATPEFVAAILRKFIWMAKRKMRGLPVTNHIMVVLLGVQGAGKSVFLRHLIGPVEELSIDADFAALEESRNIEIWSFYVHVLDEMGYATKADCETIKRVLTSETLSRRPMCSNGVEVIAQNATMIGCSNKELDQLINDATGNRRFAPLRFRPNADRDAINNAPYLLLWQSVDENGPDPMLEHMDALRALQSASRQLGPVEQWLHSFGDDGIPTYRDAEKIVPQTLYARYRVWEEEYRPGARGTDYSVWVAEMRRLLKIDKGIGDLVFRRDDKRQSYGVPFVYQSVRKDQA